MSKDVKLYGLVWKIAAGYLILTTLLAGTMAIAFYFMVRSHLVAQTGATLRQEADALAQLLAAQPLEEECLAMLLLKKTALRLAVQKNLIFVVFRWYLK